MKLRATPIGTCVGSMPFKEALKAVRPLRGEACPKMARRDSPVAFGMVPIFLGIRQATAGEEMLCKVPVDFDWRLRGIDAAERGFEAGEASAR